MKKFFAVMLVVTLLTTVFSINVVEAKSKNVSLTGEIIKVNQVESKNGRDVLALKCEEGNYILVGNVKGLSDYINSIATVKGTIFKVYKSEFMKVKGYEIVKETKPVVTSKPLPTSVPKPVITQVPSPDFKKLKGVLFSNDSEKDRFLLKTEKGIYELMGNTKGLENEFGNTLLVSGDYVYTLVATEYPLFSVDSYTVIEEPTPTPIPELKSITGTLTVTKPEVVEGDLEKYGYELKTESGPVTLNGKTEGLEKYDGQEVEVTGEYSMLAIYPPIFIVETYKPIPTPTPIPELKSITGTLTVTKPEVVEGDLEEYGYELKTESGPVTLNGKTEGLEKYDGQEVEVTGEYSMLAIYPPIFIVETYKPIPTPTPIPELKSITGTLTVTKPEVVEGDLEEYGYELKTESGPVTLNGKTEGLEKFDGQEVEVTGEYSMLAIYPPIFIVETYKPISTPTPIPELKSITGTLTVTKPEVVEGDLEEYGYELKTESGPVTLNGKTEGLEKYDGQEVEVTGEYSMLAIYPPIFIVETYKPIPTPTSIPELQSITGTLTVTKPEVVEGDLDKYGYELQTESGPVTLNGKTEGLEKYNGQQVEVTGEYSMLKIYPPIFIVETYKLVSTPIPTPIPDVYTITMDDNGGYVYIKSGEEVKLELETNPSTGYDWSYIMKPDEDVLIETNYEYVADSTDEMVVGGGGKGVWTFKAVNSGTVVIEMGYSRPWESVEPAKEFIVKIIIEEAAKPQPTVIPVPTVKPVLKAHTVTSEKALGFSLPKVSFNDISGCTTISWTEGTENAFFYSKLNVDKDIYEFELVSVKESDSEKIIGLFNIKKNGKLLMKEITGRLYGLSFQEGKYFKFYSEDEMCHMSAYITKRMDF